MVWITFVVYPVAARGHSYTSTVIGVGVGVGVGVGIGIGDGDEKTRIGGREMVRMRIIARGREREIGARAGARAVHTGRRRPRQPRAWTCPAHIARRI